MSGTSGTAEKDATIAALVRALEKSGKLPGGMPASAGQMEGAK